MGTQASCACAYERACVEARQTDVKDLQQDEAVRVVDAPRPLHSHLELPAPSATLRSVGRSATLSPRPRVNLVQIDEDSVMVEQSIPFARSQSTTPEREASRRLRSMEAATDDEPLEDCPTFARQVSAPPMRSLSPTRGRDRFQRSGHKVHTAVRLHRLLRAGPSADVGPVKCAISLEALNDFDKSAREMLGQEYKEATVRTVNGAMILPMCEQNGKAYARLLNDNRPCAGEVFVCHCWDANFGELVENINHTFHRWPRKPNLWICAFALVQTRRRTPFNRPQDAPFAAALKAAHAILVVRSKEVDLFSRIWPLWEIYLSHKFGILNKDGGLLVTGPDAFSSTNVDSRSAQASDPGDRAAIAEAITQDGSYKDVDQIARRVRDMAASVQNAPPHSCELAS